MTYDTEGLSLLHGEIYAYHKGFLKPHYPVPALRTFVKHGEEYVAVFDIASCTYYSADGSPIEHIQREKP